MPNDTEVVGKQPLVMLQVASANPQQFVCLKAEPPLRVGEAIGQRGLGVPTSHAGVGVVHRLKKERVERKVDKSVRLRVGLLLGEDKLQLMPLPYNKTGIRLWTHADVVDASGSGKCSVRFDGHRETARVERVDAIGVELQQRLAARADHERLSASRSASNDRGPAGEYGISQFRGRRKLSTVRTSAHEVGIAEPADRSVAILFPSRPEVAPAETAENRGATGVLALALKSVENFLDDVRHTGPEDSTYGAGSVAPASVNPLRRRWQASQCPHATPSGLGS